MSASGLSKFRIYYILHNQRGEAQISPRPREGWTVLETVHGEALRDRWAAAKEAGFTVMEAQEAENDANV
jgi:hypothetical protein